MNNYALKARLLFIFSIGWLLVNAQTNTSINGFIRASKGSFLPGAVISIKNESTGFVYKGISNLKGFYQVIDLPLGGPYTITASYTGYGTMQKSGYTIAIGENLKADFELSDQVTELKEVVITSRKDIYSKVSPVGTAKKLGTQEIKVIPANSRNFQDLANISPLTGVSPANNPSLSIGGTRESSTGITLDGMNQRFMMNGGLLPIFTISIEAIKEYEVSTNNYDVLQGRQGGGAINVISKSGTNNFTGSAFFYNRSNRLTAANDYLGRTLKDFNINQYGFSLGGPIIKNKLHFFTAFDFESKSQPISVLDVHDLTTEKAEGISAANLQRFLNILNTKYGLPNPADQVGLYLFKPISRTFFGRLDYKLNDRNTLTLRTNYSSQESEFSPYAYPDNTAVKESYGSHLIKLFSTQLSLKTKLTDKLTNDFKIQYLKAQRDFIPYSNLPRGFVNIASTLQDGTKVTKAFQFGGNRIAPEKQGEQQLQFVENLNLQTGKFHFTFGTDNLITFTHTLNTNEQGGLFQFSSLDDLDNLKPNAYTRLVPLNPSNGYAQYLNQTALDLAAYGQIDYRMNSRMNITGGLRWDATVFTSKPGYNPLVFQVLGKRTDKVAQDFTNIQPRIQFTYDLKGDQTSVLQIGSGLFSANIVHWAQLSNILQSGLNLANVVYPANNLPVPNYPSYRNDINTVPGVPANSGPIPAYINLIGDDFHAPMTWKNNISFKQFFNKTFYAGINLYHAYTYHNYRYVDLNLRAAPDFRLANEGNRGVFATADKVAVANPANPKVISYPIAYKDVVAHPEFGRVLELNGDSHIWQMGAVLEAGVILPSNGMISASYTLNKTEDDNSYNCCIARTTYSSGNIADDPRSLAVNRGGANTDFRNKVVVTGISPEVFGFQLGLKYVGISGNPWTPVILGDITGDASSLTINNNKRAFIFDPAVINANPNATPFEKQLATDLLTLMNNPANTAGKYLKDHLGQMASRNEMHNPFWSNIDISLSYTLSKKLIPALKNNKLIFQAQVFNFANLLDKNAGKRNIVSGTNQQLFRTLGLDPVAQAQGKIQYAYQVNPSFGQLIPANDRYQVQLGIRYEFR
jgi:hypothetical protein